jgi:protein-S-isoprenylcysteine O-methyltransferase Ste14
MAPMTKLAAEFIWCAGIVAWYVIRHPFNRRARKTPVARTMRDSLEWTLLAFATVGFFIIPAFYIATGIPALLDRPFVPGVAIFGVVVMLLALLLFWRSHHDLGRNWSVSLQLRKEHRLVTAGVYRDIRHPMYSSFILLGLAQLLLLPNWFAGLAGLVGGVLLFALRFAREEQMMIEYFGDEYRAYAARTKRIIPWLY